MQEQTYRKLWEEGVSILKKAGIAEASLDARLLLEDCCGTNTQTLLAHGERPVSDKEREQYETYIERRSRREPVAYILEEQDFMGLSFYVTPSVLIPNQDTETLTEEAMKILSGGMRILDLCTGSGCILLSLLHYAPDCYGVGTDLSADALQIAEENAKRLKLQHRCIWQRGDLFEALKDLPEESTEESCPPFGEKDDHTEVKFDVIVSNPPYIATDVIETLAPEVKNAEPYGALDGGADGLLFYRELAAKAAKWLRIGGKLLLEIGYDQGEQVSALLKENDWLEITVIKDYSGNDRVVKAERGLHTKFEI